MLVMQFSQEGIDELRKYQEHMEMRHPEGDFMLSDGFDEGTLGLSQGGLVKVFFTNGCGGGIALTWFKDHFLRCNDRAALVKTWLPAQYTGPSTWVDELVYNRALTLVRIPFLPSPLTSTDSFILSRNLRAVQQRVKNCSISTSRPMNASAYMRSRCGVYMRCRTTCYRRAIRSWRRTVIRLPPVRTSLITW